MMSRSVPVITHYSSLELALNAFRRDNLTSHGGCSGNGRVRQVDASVLVAHAPREVAIAGGDAHVVRTHDAHVASQAGATGACCHDSAGIGKDLDQAFFQRLLIDVLSSRNDYALNVVVDLF